jgi:hypothetical protein
MSCSIAIVIESLGRGGAKQVAATLANIWVAEGVDVTVVTFQGANMDVFRLDHCVRRIAIGGNKKSRNFITALIANMHNIRLPGLGQRVFILERNDPTRQLLGRAWDWMQRLLYRCADRSSPTPALRLQRRWHLFPPIACVGYRIQCALRWRIKTDPCRSRVHSCSQWPDDPAERLRRTDRCVRWIGRFSAGLAACRPIGFATCVARDDR